MALAMSSSSVVNTLPKMPSDVRTLFEPDPASLSESGRSMVVVDQKR